MKSEKQNKMKKKGKKKGRSVTVVTQPYLAGLIGEPGQRFYFATTKCLTHARKLHRA